MSTAESPLSPLCTAFSSVCQSPAGRGPAATSTRLQRGHIEYTACWDFGLLWSQVRIMYRKYGIWRRRSGSAEIYNCSHFYIFAFWPTATGCLAWRHRRYLLPDMMKSVGVYFLDIAGIRPGVRWFGELGKYQSGGNNDFFLIGGK